MNLENFYKRFNFDRSLEDETNFNPYYPVIESALGKQVIINSEEYINLAANNYLGLAADRRVKQAAIKGIEKYGVSLCGTPIATGSIILLKKLEKKLAQFTGLEDAIIYPSCYQANNGIFTAICQKNDLVLVDHYAHSSLLEGIRACGCKVLPFLHNNLQSLERILKKSKEHYPQIFIVTESVFSTEGSISPFKEICELAKKYKAIPLIDDSHGIGVLGKKGQGILEEKNIRNFKGIYTASLGKALASSGGVIAGPKKIIEYLRYYSSHFVYSTALPPAQLAALDTIIDIINEDFASLSKTMWNYWKKIQSALKKTGLSLSKSKAPITSIICKTSHETFLITKKLFKQKILTTPFVYPSVPRHAGKIRIIAGANLKKETIDQAIDIFENLGQKDFK